MNLSKRYLSLVVLAFAPAFHGCVYDSLHAEGKVDAQRGDKAETAPKGDISLKSEENTNEDSKRK